MRSARNRARDKLLPSIYNMQHKYRCQLTYTVTLGLTKDPCWGAFAGVDRELKGDGEARDGLAGSGAAVGVVIATSGIGCGVATVDGKVAIAGVPRRGMQQTRRHRGSLLPS